MSEDIRKENAKILSEKKEETMMNKWKTAIEIIGNEVKRAAENTSQRISEETSRIEHLRNVMLNVKEVTTFELLEYEGYLFHFQKSVEGGKCSYDLFMRAKTNSYHFTAPAKSLKQFEELVFSNVEEHIAAFEKVKKADEVIML